MGRIIVLQIFLRVFSIFIQNILFFNIAWTFLFQGRRKQKWTTNTYINYRWLQGETEKKQMQKAI